MGGASLTLLNIFGYNYYPIIMNHEIWSLRNELSASMGYVVYTYTIREAPVSNTSIYLAIPTSLYLLHILDVNLTRGGGEENETCI